MPRIPARRIALVIVVAATVAACAGSASTPAPSPAAVVREDLGSTLPATAPGQELTLWRYVIPAGADLAPHSHPGWQIARVAAGTLTYTVLTGAAEVWHADGSTESVAAGTTVRLEPGDSIIENPDEHHEATNGGSIPVEMWATSLLDAGSDVSIPDPTPTP